MLLDQHGKLAACGSDADNLSAGESNFSLAFALQVLSLSSDTTRDGEV